ncbi:MAG TPA: methyltransferase domain-containing protein [Gemmataceae bacterium]|nr:methyltransferase domain-containing protein [Gemmataceae bacterium]
MKLRTAARRLRWVVLFLAVAAGAWWAAFSYLIDFRTPDVPFVTTPPDVVAAMLDLADVKAGDVVYDLGSGDGRIPIAAAGRGAKAVGVELDPQLVEHSQDKVRVGGLADRVTIRRGDIFKQDLTPATVVTLYLKPLVNKQLRPQLDALRPGTRIVSHMFSMPGAKPAKVIQVPSDETKMDHRLYLWVTPIEWE